MKKLFCILLVGVLLTSALSGCSFIEDFVDDYEITDDIVITEDNDSDTIVENTDKEENKDEENDETKQEEVKNSILSQDKIPYSFIIDSKEITLPIKYSELANMINLKAEENLDREITFKDTVKIPAKVNNLEITLTINCFETADVKTKLTDCYVTGISGNAQDGIIFYKQITSKTTMKEIKSIYGDGDFENAGLEELLVYYKLPLCSYDVYNIGIEFIFDMNGNMKSFTYGDTNKGYLEEVKW